MKGKYVPEISLDGVAPYRVKKRKKREMEQIWKEEVEQAYLLLEEKEQQSGSKDSLRK